MQYRILFIVARSSQDKESCVSFFSSFQISVFNCSINNLLLLITVLLILIFISGKLYLCIQFKAKTTQIYIFRVLLFYAILSHGLKMHKHEEIIWYYYMEFIFLWKSWLKYDIFMNILKIISRWYIVFYKFQFSWYIHGFYTLTMKKYVYYKWNAWLFWELNETTSYKWQIRTIT